MKTLIFLLTFAAAAHADDIVSVGRLGSTFVVVRSVAGSPGTTMRSVVPNDDGNKDCVEVKQWLKQPGHTAPTLPDPMAPKVLPPVERRAERYRNEADPLLLSAYGYDLELAAETDPVAKAKIQAKRDKAAADYVATKKRIRTEVPD